MSISKTAKSLLAAFATMVMAFVVATPAFAATINITGNNGETYTAYKVLDVTTAKDGEGNVTGYNYTTASEAVANVFEDEMDATVTPSPAGNLWYVTWDATNADSLTTYFAGLDDTELVALLGQPVGSVELDGTTGSITNLGAGYYYVTSTLGSMCMLNTAADTVTIEDKNAEPTVDKKVDGASTSDAQIGDTVTYTVTVNVPANTEKLTLNDTLSNGLTLNTGSFQIAIDDGEAVSLNAPSTTTSEDGSTSFSIALTSYLEQLTNGGTITVTYTATVNENAVSTNPATNEATVNYGNASSTSSTTTTKTHTLTINKTDAQGNPLNGAEFQLKDADNNLVYVVATSTGYRVATSSTESGATTTIVVNGSVTIDGLDAETYTLTETKAPEGYNLLTESKDAVVNVDNTASVNVVNQAGSTLPTTGGMGTTVLYAVGAALVIGAGITLVVRRRMNHEA